MISSKDARLRRFALQIVQQLPENQSEAIKVLEYARELVSWEHAVKPTVTVDFQASQTA